MPTTTRKGIQVGEGSEPVVSVNPDPPIRPGAGADVDPHVRVEQVAPMVPAIELEGTEIEAYDAVSDPAAFAGGPTPLSAFLAVTPEPGQGAVSMPHEYVGYREPDLIETGVTHELEEGGDEYLVVCRPWVNLVLQDERFFTARRGDHVVILPETAKRALGMAAILPVAVPQPVAF